jgi:O-antigen ligase
MSARVRPAVRTRLARIADSLAIAIAVSLPWSNSATAILILFWLLALLPVLNLADLRREIATPAGGLPVALFALSLLGMTWAGVSWGERLGGMDAFFKLLLIPLLLVQFRRSERGIEVVAGYLASCTALLAASSILALWPWPTAIDFSAIVKNAASQSGEFVACAFALLFLAHRMFRSGRRSLAAGMLALALAFLADNFCIAAAPTAWFIISVQALVIIPVLFVLLGFKIFNARRMLGLLAAAAALCAVAWTASPDLQDRTVTTWETIQPGSSHKLAGDRPMFWKKSLSFIEEAPLLGHGTGSIRKLFDGAAAGQPGGSESATTNPHQQTLAVGIQLGLVGIALLWAMWISHLLLFRGDTLPAWVGLVIVTQNIVGSLLESDLFDFTQGWVYVFAVGVAGGMVRRLRADAAAR